MVHKEKRRIQNNEYIKLQYIYWRNKTTKNISKIGLMRVLVTFDINGNASKKFSNNKEIFINKLNDYVAEAGTILANAHKN